MYVAAEWRKTNSRSLVASAGRDLSTYRRIRFASAVDNGT
jgi:hypothetical protein